jgi:hypothetical protein
MEKPDRNEVNNAKNRARWAAEQNKRSGYDFPAGSQRHWDAIDSVWIVTFATGEVIEFGNC